MLNVWNPVLVKNPAHPRNGTAGTVTRTNPVTHPDSVFVKFDTDGQGPDGAALPGSEEDTQIADLVRLG